MGEETENPYAAPEAASGEATVGLGVKPNRTVALVGGLILSIAATALSFVFPAFAVPAALLFMPFALRTIEVNRVRRASQTDMSVPDWIQLIVYSMLAAIPVGAASLVLFCCICTPLGFANMFVFDPGQYGPGPLGLGASIFTGMVFGLWLGHFILVWGGYFSPEVKQAHRQTPT